MLGFAIEVVQQHNPATLTRDIVRYLFGGGVGGPRVAGVDGPPAGGCAAAAELGVHRETELSVGGAEEAALGDPAGEGLVALADVGARCAGKGLPTVAVAHGVAGRLVAGADEAIDEVGAGLRAEAEEEEGGAGVVGTEGIEDAGRQVGAGAVVVGEDDSAAIATASAHVGDGGDTAQLRGDIESGCRGGGGADRAEDRDGYCVEQEVLSGAPGARSVS